MERPLTSWVEMKPGHILKGKRFQYCTTGGAIANVYAEVVHENSEEEDDSDLEYQVEEKEESGSEGDDHVISTPIAISSPSKDLERYISFKDWEGDDLENLEEDEEVKQYRRHVKMVKKGIKGREDIYEALVQARHQVPQLYVDEDLDVGNDTPYFDSSEEASYDDEEGPEISGCRRKSRFPRFDDATPLPIFQDILSFLKMRRGGSEPSVHGMVTPG
uniref:Uncharacterized protein n=1 Tax=Setaria viridis TaxID=4556 RepID=A0A4U6TRN2_SETVI|nr:hypothetical protein SEVIR_7G176500v2 [Setaria viridis]